MTAKRKVATRQAKSKETLPFWRRKRLAEMTPVEWEQLCDGCGKCCLHKLEDVDTGEISYTNVACRLLDLGTCRCTDYKHRRKLVHDCLQLSPQAIRELKWLPPTCGYRLVDAGEDLYWWHPLVSGDPETVHQAGISVRGRAIAEARAGDLEEHIVDWKD
ncbi:MAG TPA: YcgN family cysteine cluster protein [Candidatus Sulfotelmatobacter sp.]|nr:YcgN family cysteine cluster protein [Candidatus Sulfotelmatobacter sp.]